MVAMNVWPTDAAAGSVATEARWRSMARTWAPTAVLADAGSGLGPSINGTQITIGSGACWVDGHYCELLSQQTLAGSANGIVVVRFDPAANTAELLYRDGVTTPTQNPTGTFELLIAKVTGGVLLDCRPLIRHTSPTVIFPTAAGRDAAWPAGAVGKVYGGSQASRGDATPAVPDRYVDVGAGVGAWVQQHPPIRTGYVRSAQQSAAAPPNDIAWTSPTIGGPWPFPTLHVCHLVMWAGFATAQAIIDFQAYSNAATNGPGGALAVLFGRQVTVNTPNWSVGITGTLCYQLAANAGPHVAARAWWTGGGAGVWFQADLSFAVYQL